MKRKYDFASKLLVLGVIACLMVAFVGCSLTTIVQKTVTGLNIVKNGIAEINNLMPELQTINPELATVTAKFTALAGPTTDNLITIGNNYLAKPSGDGYQQLLNGVDAMTQSIDTNVLASERVINVQSQAKVIASLVIISVGSHGVLDLLESKATQAQLKAMPVITARVDFNEIKRLVGKDPDRIRSELARMTSPYEANQLMEHIGF